MPEGCNYSIFPWDDHNQKLVSYVRPLGWQNPKPAQSYNLVIIGGGTAGLVTSVGAAGLGAKVALVEKHFLGGDCLNYGCVPSKALVRSARAVAEARRASEFGVKCSDIQVDFNGVMERMRRLRASISPHDSAKRLSELGVDVFLGAAEFKDSETIGVNGEELKFSKAVISTGARALVPPIEGLINVRYLTNETLFSLTHLPDRIAIIGAGPIGCEMAQCFARFGSEVFLIESAHGILPREDPEAATIVKQSLERDGVKLLCCGKALKVSNSPLPSTPSVSAHSRDTRIRVRLDSHDQGYDLEVDHLLLAVGRAPNVEGLGLEKVGIEFNSKGVKVDDFLRTTQPNVYACGDICSRYQFTHSADFMARIVIQNALFKGRSKFSSLVIPRATYTSPEIAHVGLDTNEAKEVGIPVETFTQEFSRIDRAILDGDTEGFVRVHVRKGTDKLVGATIVANHAGDLIGELALALKSRIGLRTIGATIHPYPTHAEAIRKLGDLQNRTRLTPWLREIMGRWLAWHR